jgi:hypothetical protein
MTARRIRYSFRNLILLTLSLLLVSLVSCCPMFKNPNPHFSPLLALDCLGWSDRCAGGFSEVARALTQPGDARNPFGRRLDPFSDLSGRSGRVIGVDLHPSRTPSGLWIDNLSPPARPAFQQRNG